MYISHSFTYRTENNVDTHIFNNFLFYFSSITFDNMLGENPSVMYLFV